MEAFSERNVFGDSVDESGFFTMGIWCGILLMAIVIIVLVFAVDMTYSITTMDYFDDPKGQNLQIRAG